MLYNNVYNIKGLECNFQYFRKIRKAKVIEYIDGNYLLIFYIEYVLKPTKYILV